MVTPSFSRFPSLLFTILLLQWSLRFSCISRPLILNLFLILNMIQLKFQLSVSKKVRMISKKKHNSKSEAHGIGMINETTTFQYNRKMISSTNHHYCLAGSSWNWHKKLNDGCASYNFFKTIKSASKKGHHYGARYWWNWHFNIFKIIFNHYISRISSSIAEKNLKTSWLTNGNIQYIS